MATPTCKGRQDSKVGAARVQEREENATLLYKMMSWVIYFILFILFYFFHCSKFIWYFSWYDT